MISCYRMNILAIRMKNKHLVLICIFCLLSAPDSRADEIVPTEKSEWASIGKKLASPKPSKLEWDMWHKSVAEAVYQKYRIDIKNANLHEHLIAKVSYTVTKNRKIINLKLVEKSKSKKFNKIILTAINSISNSHHLKFPKFSTKKFVSKSGTFIWNGDTDNAVQSFLKGNSDTLRGYDLGEKETIKLKP